LVDITTLPIRLTADPARVVIRPLHIARAHPSKPNRTQRIVDAVLALSDAESDEENALVDHDFDGRHWQTQGVYLTRFRHVAEELGLDPSKISPAKQELIGASFCHEYSYAAAAIMNPSIVPHPDQSGLAPGDVRFVMSLRTVGEGHISSIAFREGIVYADGTMGLHVQPPFAMAVNGISGQPKDESDVRVSRDANATLSGSVIFPFTRQQRNGLEDLRLVRFAEPGEPPIYHGTYTAYSGADIASELLSTCEFRDFRLRAMHGRAAKSKGMALFPRRINGRYAVIGRQDNENLYYLESDDLLAWDEGVRIMGPRFAWERIQIGNCGAPIELDEGWLLLTHGVGAMRQYSIGAALLDKDDPRKVLARTPLPLVRPSDESREGYVPNVVYTCGALTTNGFLFMPYGVADSSVAFCTIPLKSVLESMV